MGPGGSYNRRIFEILAGAKYTLPQGVSAELADLFTHLLDPNPESRYSAAQALAHPWLQLAVDADGGADELHAAIARMEVEDAGLFDVVAALDSAVAMQAKLGSGGAVVHEDFDDDLEDAGF